MYTYVYEDEHQFASEPISWPLGLTNLILWIHHDGDVSLAGVVFSYSLMLVLSSDTLCMIIETNPHASQCDNMAASCSQHLCTSHALCHLSHPRAEGPV